MKITPEQKQDLKKQRLEDKLIARQWSDFITKMEKKGAIVTGSLTGPDRIKIKYSNNQVVIQYNSTISTTVQ